MAESWYDGVTFSVEVAFATAPLAATPTWTDVTAYLVDVPSIRFGRTSEFSEIAPATCSIVLRNGDRRFDPEYTSGPYYPNLLPMKKVRVRATYNAVTYDLFVGYAQGWPQSYRHTFDSTVTIDCVDGSRFLEQAKLQATAYESVVMIDGPVAYWPFQESSPSVGSTWVDIVSGAEASQQSISPEASDPLTREQQYPVGAQTSVSNGVREDSAGFTIPGIYASEPISEAPYGLEFWCNFGSASLTTSPQVTARAAGSGGNQQTVSVYNNAGTLEIAFADAATGDSLVVSSGVQTPFRIAHVALWCDGSDVFLYVNGVQEFTGALTAATVAAASDTAGLTIFTGWDSSVSTAPSVSDRSYFSHVAVYGAGTEPDWYGHYVAGLTAFGHPYGERSGARIGRVLDEVGWPAADRDIDTGDTVQGPFVAAGSSPLAYMRAVEQSELGLLFIDQSGNVRFIGRQGFWFDDEFLTDGSGNILTDGSGEVLLASQVVFSDDGSDVAYSDIDIDANTVDAVRNQVTVSDQTGATVTREDSTSITNYGVSGESVSLSTVRGISTLQGFADYRLRTSKDPQTRITRLEVRPRGNAAAFFPTVLGLTLGDVVVVERSPQGVGSAIVKRLVVQGYDHSVSHGGEWVTTVYLSPAPQWVTEVPYFVVGDTTFGVIGAAAGNKIPF